MERLNEKLNKLKEKSKYKDILLNDSIKDLYNVYPFNEFEYVMTHFIEEGLIDIEEYYNIRNEYMERNKYLYVFEYTAPRGFGETWAQRHLNELVPELKRPNKKYDATYNGEYDFWYQQDDMKIKIEVKASRAVDSNSDEQLIVKALSSDSKLPFDMNFQQIKPKCCDVFVWIAVWRNEIKYWVLSSSEVENNNYFSKGQHRGNIGEGQLWIKDTNIEEFNEYLVQPRDLLEAIKAKYCKKI